MKRAALAALIAVLTVTMGGLVGSVIAGEPIATLRNAEIGLELPAPPMAKPVKKELRKARNYPEQPPIIPHKIRGYQIDLNSNKCLTCHSRTSVEQSQAPMVSVTHFMDRQGQVRAYVSPRRYFCNQCHMTQTESLPLTGNTFLDVGEVIRKMGN